MKKSETSQLFRKINIRILNVVFDDKRDEESQAWSHWRLSIYVTLFKHAPWSSSRLYTHCSYLLFHFTSRVPCKLCALFSTPAHEQLCIFQLVIKQAILNSKYNTSLQHMKIYYYSIQYNSKYYNFNLLTMK